MNYKVLNLLFDIYTLKTTSACSKAWNVSTVLFLSALACWQHLLLTNSFHGYVKKSISLESLMDPWGCDANSVSVGTKFEDNFIPTTGVEKLADSAEYIAILERKLKAVRSKNKVVENLAAYRADCINRLMREGCDLDPVIGDTESEELLQDN